jgi:hypothetical protein
MKKTLIISELRQLFEEINKLKSKASLNTCQFCSELTNSDDDEYLELHFSLLEQKKRYFQSDLKLYFTFRKNREKVHNFLKNKLQNLQDEQLRNDVKEILSDLNYSSLDELKQWIKDLKSGKRDDKDEFVWSIMKSPFVEYHYSLITDKEISEDFYQHLWLRFDEHREKGAELLLSKLDNNEDMAFHAAIIFCLGKFANKSKTVEERTLEYVRKFANTDDDLLRETAIIVLGWIGSEKDISLLGEHLLNDTNAKCRTLSATSFMQMYFRRKSQSLADKALPYLKQAISQETDFYALGCMIDVVKELTGKKFDLPQYAIDNLDKEKILEAKQKVERFFKKITPQ